MLAAVVEFGPDPLLPFVFGLLLGVLPLLALLLLLFPPLGFELTLRFHSDSVCLTLVVLTIVLWVLWNSDRRGDHIGGRW